MPKKRTTKKPAFPMPPLKKGEAYIGAIVLADGSGHHVILLPGDESLPWKAALAWAKKKGGDLPNRIEQAMFFADHKDKFQNAWYWSNTTYAGYAVYAWLQSFGFGLQYGLLKSYVSRCRAVRRVAI